MLIEVFICFILSWSIVGGKFPVSKLKDEEVKAYHDQERQDMQKILDNYLLICRRAGVLFPLSSLHVHLVICYCGFVLFF